MKFIIEHNKQQSNSTKSDRKKSQKSSEMSIKNCAQRIQYVEYYYYNYTVCHIPTFLVQYLQILVQIIAIVKTR